MQKSTITQILSVGFLGLLLAWTTGFTGIAHASEVSGTLSSDTTSSQPATGSIAGNVVGGTSNTGGSTNTSGSSGGGSSGGGYSFFATGGGNGTYYTATPIAQIGAPAAGGPVNPMIAYTSYPDYSGSNSGAGTSGGSSADSSDSASTSTLPGVPATGGTLSPGDSLMAATTKGGLSTAAAIAIAILGIAVLGGAAYGINSVYRRNRGL